MARMIELKTPLGKDLLFRSLRGREGLGRSSDFELSALSTRSDIKPSDLLGKKVTVKLERVKGTSLASKVACPTVLATPLGRR